VKIIVIYQGDGCRAYLENHFEIYGRGKTENEAVGDLICSYRSLFKIIIMRKDGNKNI